VLLLEAALKAAGQTPTQACNYSFPYTDVFVFTMLSSPLYHTSDESADQVSSLFRLCWRVSAPVPTSAVRP